MLIGLRVQYLCACNVTIVSCVVSEKSIPSLAQRSFQSHSLNISQPPIIPFKDPMYTVAYPESGDWKPQVGAERLLVLAALFLMNLIHEFGNPAEMERIRRSMEVLDGEISRSLAELKASGSSGPMSFHRRVALVRLHRYVLRPRLLLENLVILTFDSKCANQSPSLLRATGRRQRPSQCKHRRPSRRKRLLSVPILAQCCIRIVDQHHRSFEQ